MANRKRIKKNNVEMSVHDLFNEKLIEEVKKYEFIYNMAYRDRRKGTISEEKWSEIATAVNGTVKKCKSRWSNLRRRYTIEYTKMTSNEDGEYESKWKHMDAMSFMEGYMGQDEHFLENLSKLSKRDLYCRTCLRPVTNEFETNSDCHNIFGAENFAEKLMQCTNLNIVPWDKYPHSLCKKCYEKVWDFCRFQDMCRESMEKFNVMLEKQPDVRDENHEEEIADSFVDSIIEYTDVDYLVTEEQPDENSTSVGQVQYIKEDPDQDTEIECQNKIEIAVVVDPLEKNSRTDLVSEEEQVDENTTELTETCEDEEGGAIFKSKRSLTNKSASKENYHKDISNQSELLDDFSRNSAEMNIEEEPIDIKVEDHLESGEDEIDEDNDAKLESQSDDENSVLDDTKAPDVIEKTRSKYPLNCDMCPKSFLYSHRLEAHQRKHRGLPEFPCTFANCSRAFRRLTDLRHHLNDHNGIPNIYKCDIENCDAMFPSMHLRYQHKVKVHRDKKEAKTYTCDTCGKVITTLPSLKAHRYLHVDKSLWPYGCDIEGCTDRFRFLMQKKTHLKRHAGIKNYICPHCGMRKTTSTELSIHINLHTFEKKYPCRICPKVFKSVGSMSTHIRVVHEGKPRKPTSVGTFQCSYCDRKLCTAMNKKYHEMSHTGEKKPYGCDECDKTFESPSMLKHHKNKHGDKQYDCKVCGKRYKWPMHLKTHMKVHLDGVNPFPCEICGKRFKWQSHLKTHVMLHSEEGNPYKCEECGKEFRWPASLYTHKKTHEKEKIKQEIKEEPNANLDL